MDVYLNDVKVKYGIDSLQALSVLFQLDYNIEEALAQICHTVS